MAQHKILHAEQGAKGGYQIIRDLAKFSLGELSDMIIGPIEIANCFHGDYSECSINATCHIIAPMLALNENIKKLFSTIMLTNLIDSKHQSEQSIRNKETFSEDVSKAR
jgi:DNA-binding IscR family transcriptional regulator